MGWNEGYRIMEQTVIAAYDAGLRGEQLAPFMEPYRESDIDEGGMVGLSSKDGKYIEEIIVEAFGSDDDLRLYRKSHGMEPLGEGENGEDLEEKAFDVLRAITRGRFGWD